MLTIVIIKTLGAIFQLNYPLAVLAHLGPTVHVERTSKRIHINGWFGRKWFGCSSRCKTPKAKFRNLELADAHVLKTDATPAR